MKKIALIYRDHYNNEWTRNRFKKVESELNKINIECFHSSENPSIKYQIFEPALFYKHHFFMNNSEIFILDFFNKNQNYDFYFHMDYDVFYNGDISLFMKDIMENEFDFLSAYINSKEEYSQKYNCENMWIAQPNSFPNHYKLLHAFIPFNGYSKSYISFLDNYYKENGIPAFCEVSLPTLALNNNFKLFDINNTKYIDEESFNGKKANVDRENMLYHHIKHQI
jgi:hypothetical protein